jgi:hypothetical protein
MKGGKVVLLAAMLVLATALFSASVNAQVFTGVVDGYVMWENGTTISGASVSATVSGCTGAGCTNTTTTQANGYYVRNNLNMISGDSVGLTATSGVSTGCNSTIAGGGGVAHVNITMLPSAPTLTPQADTHSQSVSLSWTTGTDPGAATPLFDQYQFNSGGYSTQTSPQSQPGLSFTSYIWNVKTCNSAGCTCTPASDTFLVFNNPPPAPNLGTFDTTNESSVLLNWTNVTDPEGDVVHYEYQFGELNQPANHTDNAATSPENESVFNAKVYHWQVSACDNYGACSMNDTTFTVCGGACPVCAAGGGGGGAVSCGVAVAAAAAAPSYVSSISAPLSAKQGDEITVYINFKSNDNTNIVNLQVAGDPAIIFEPVVITNLSANTEKTVAVKGKIANDATATEHILKYVATRDGREVLSKQFNLTVQGAAVCGNGVCENTENIANCPQDCLKRLNYSPFLALLAMIAAIIAYWLYEKKSKPKRSAKKRRR